MYLLAFAESIQLFPDGTLFIHIALILIMIWVLNRTFFRPINRIIESREKHKGGVGGEAETILKDVADKQGRYNKSMLEARSEGYDLIEKHRAAAVAECRPSLPLRRRQRPDHSRTRRNSFRIRQMKPGYQSLVRPKKWLTR